MCIFSYMFQDFFRYINNLVKNQLKLMNENINEINGY